jgi:hypothetical protein
VEQLLAVGSAAAYDIIEVRYVDQADIIVPEANFMCGMLALVCIQRATTACERTAVSPACDAAPQAPAIVRTGGMGGHCLEENPDTVENEQGLKKRQRSCKVCAQFTTKPRKYTKYFCPECSTGNRRYVAVALMSAVQTNAAFLL